jgi:hypothetical protein
MLAHLLLEVRNVKLQLGLCPGCFRESLARVVDTTGSYWRCLNRDCGQTFLPEMPDPTVCEDRIFDGNVNLSEDHLEATKRFRIPTTAAGQVYELRRMFRQ